MTGSSQEIRFKHITSNDGLSQNTVLAITQDSDGFMWFGTKDGLNKYDGYSFTIYQNVPSDPKTIDSNYITALFTDSRGNLWVGTENGLLNRYDKGSDTFQRIGLPFTNSDGQNNYEIKDITEGKNGTIWVGTRDYGVFKVPLLENVVQEKLIKQYRKEEKGPYNLSNNIIRELYEDKNEILWIGTNNGLTRMDVKKETFAPFYFDVKDPKAPKNVLDGAVTSIYGTTDGFLWLGTLSGLIKFNTRNYSYEFFPHHYTVDRYGWGEITEIVEGHKQNLWLGTPGELMFFNTENKVFTYFRNDPHRQESISYNSISGLYKDRTNIIWIGTVGMGIDYYDPKSHRFSLLKRGPDKNSRITGFSLRSILEENDRYVWVAGEVLYRWDRKTNTLKSFETTSKRVDDFGNVGPYSMVKARDGNLWFASSEGLYVYDPTLEKAEQFKFNKDKPEGVPQKNVFTVFEDKEGQLWIATENFLSRMTDKKKGLFKHYRYALDPEYFLYLRPVLYDDGKKLWLGTKKGLLAFDKKKESFHTYKNDPNDPASLINNHIKSICPDPENPDRYLWIGTSAGLEMFDKTKGSFKHFTEKDGLPNNVIYGILSDHQNKLWLSTNKGISRFSPSEKAFRNFEINDGLQNNEFNTGAYFKSDKGELFFGGLDGMNYFFPEQIKDNPFIPPIALTGIRVYNGSKKDEEKNSFVSIPVYDKNAMTFTSKDYIIWLKFAALDFSTSEKNHYAYKLEGFHDDWIYIQNSRNVSFTHLPSGQYTFKLKASNNDGVWNETGISIPMRIMPHWSQSWWAYCLYFLLLMMLLYIIRRYEINRILVKNQLEVERIEKGTLRELDHLKSQFFTNISHEFRTPLTLISGRAESLLKDLKVEKNREQIKHIRLHSQKLLLLINQLLDISKLEAGKWQLQGSQNNLVLFLKNLFYSFESMADQKKIQLRFLSDSDDIQAVFDIEKMEKIICNLVSNALKFTLEKGLITMLVERER
ncbi:MAG: two-component regulator propeller domain-containing protein [Flavobacteriaceae bacterium]|nr:two-component regulator propeller domain-containing protein [Flavobacteriaceae bacterium]